MDMIIMSLRLHCKSFSYNVERYHFIVNRYDDNANRYDFKNRNGYTEILQTVKITL